MFGGCLVPCLHEEQRKVGMDKLVMRPQSFCFFPFRYRSAIITLAVIGHAQRKLSIKVCRLRLQDSLELPDRLIVIAPAEIEHCFVILLLQRFHKNFVSLFKVLAWPPSGNTRVAGFGVPCWHLLPRPGPAPLQSKWRNSSGSWRSLRPLHARESGWVLRSGEVLEGLPALLGLRVKLRIYRWYQALLSVERDLHTWPREQHGELMTRLDHIERQVNQMKVPASFADQFYALRGSIGFVRERLADGAQPR